VQGQSKKNIRIKTKIKRKKGGWVGKAKQGQYQKAV
jgi:hypothetical protein